jgi:rubrerythrin
MSGKTDFGINEHSTPGDALQLAMKREQLAQDFYLQCAKVVGDPGVKKLFEFLAREESKHHELIEKEYNRFVAGEN